MARRSNGTNKKSKINGNGQNGKMFEISPDEHLDVSQLETEKKDGQILMNILQYESKIWATADLLRGCGIKESEWPSFMMPFFALALIESRLIRMFDGLKAEIGEEAFDNINKDDLYDMIKDHHCY